MTPRLPTFAHLYSAAFLKGGRVRNELLAVAGASYAFVVVSKSLNQCACGSWRKEPAANWRNYQASNQRVRIGDRLCNSCWVCAVGDIQFGRDQLMRQCQQAVALCWRVENRQQLEISVVDAAECKAGYRP